MPPILDRVTTRLLTITALILAGCGLAGVALHYLDITSDVVARFASVTPYLILASMIGLLAALFTRRPVVIGVVAAVVAAGVFTQLPLYLASAPEPHDDDLTVFQANLYLGTADVSALARTVAEHDVDILTVSELTDSALAQIEKSSIAAQLPYSAAYPVAEGGGGTGLFSRYPLENAERLPDFALANVRAETVVGGRRHAVYALHPVPPWPEPAWHWETELARLSDRLWAEQLPLIAGGDFNSTYDHVQLRRLFAETGTEDAAEQTGAGIVATYPANRAVLPAVLAIDRVLVGPGTGDSGSGPQATSFERVKIPGSDHHGVIARIRL